jgi:hypothetical protein
MTKRVVDFIVNITQHNEGFAACMAGQRVNTNPYPYGPLMVAWNDGWFAVRTRSQPND